MVKGDFPYEQKSHDGLIHTDHLATPHKMTDANQAVVWSAYYKPFGAATITVSTVTNNIRFPGQYYDAETGLSYNCYRDYNPVIGRYLESDPLSLPFIHNRETYFVPSNFAMTPSHLHDYLYTSNNPIIFTDPEGLCDGQWSQAGYDRFFNFVCKCYWLCI